ncbi:ClbS/DfsB family four-helix bundle protein [Chitinophaga sancti]|uniref:ClbS/DfsB family four-helix bundle protein n=1 Tax=Chitinophaga sancti TaxID=1004 RepID=A0A1K1SX83_9BACT|nr:ClbS/DfsB family four-helix bundle protein [Chitinophaga sancti]WQD62288.1 ClbS/DfsB family four-helix bundle protein [Chitinophaga sancti]WQG92143.1 ClbS/DfsB family four-helix bundle protein [Chitinophaga sancti]SFW89000.1 hypothetical protein SAMN05661012_06355 [Chitinophaga sancti]
MGVPTNKTELEKAIRLNYGSLLKELSSITYKEATKKELEGHTKGSLMNVHDLVAYLVGWGELVLKWNRLMDNGEPVDFPETGYKWNELGKLAQKFYIDHAASDYKHLLEKLDATVTEILSLIAGKSNQQLYGTPWYTKWTLGRMIQFNTSSPYANARARIRKWKKSKEGDQTKKNDTTRRQITSIQSQTSPKKRNTSPPKKHSA